MRLVSWFYLIVAIVAISENRDWSDGTEWIEKYEALAATRGDGHVTSTMTSDGQSTIKNEQAILTLSLRDPDYVNKVVYFCAEHHFSERECVEIFKQLIQKNASVNRFK